MQLVTSAKPRDDRTKNNSSKKEELTHSTHFHTFSIFPNGPCRIFFGILLIELQFSILFSQFLTELTNPWIIFTLQKHPTGHIYASPWRCVTGSFSSRGAASIFNSARGDGTKLAFAAANMAVWRGWRNSSSNFRGLPSTLCALDWKKEQPWKWHRNSFKE